MASTEAPRSVNFYGISKEGWDCQYTVRAVDNETLIKDKLDLIARLTALGVVPKGGHKPAPVSIPKGIESVEVNKPPPMPSEPVQAARLENPDAAYTFEADLLVGSTSGDKVYWKVQGGQFKVHGVTIWPEVLEAAGFDPKLDPTQEYTLAGYTAYYVLNDKGNPKKVVNLAKE